MRKGFVALMELVLKSKEKRIPIVLFASIVLMLFPFIISYQILNTAIFLNQLVAFSYLLLVLSMLLAFNRKIGKTHLFILVVYFIIQLLPLVIGSFRGIEISNLDLLNIITKTINITIFLLLVFFTTINNAQFTYFLRCFMFFSLLSCLYNFVININDIIHIGNITSGYAVSLKSFFVNKNQFGGFLFVSIVTKYYLLSGRRIKLVDVMVLAFLFLNLFLTMSRGAILATVLFLIVLYMYRLKSIKIIFSFVAIFFIVIMTTLLNEKLMNFIINNVLRVNSGVTGRSEIWAMGLNIYSENNLLNGVGYFSGVSLAKLKGFQFEEFHSFYIDTLVSGGVLELAFTISILFYVLYRCVHNCNNEGYKKVYISSFVGFIALGFFESISLFTIGYVGTLFTIFYITIPIMLSKLTENHDNHFMK